LLQLLVQGKPGRQHHPDRSGRASGGSPERFDYNFVDDAAGWREFKLPFSSFGLATDYQPGPDNGILDLTDILGYNFGIVTSPSSGSFQIDQVALFGQPIVGGGVAGQHQRG
jgi:beta-glucosidase